MSSLYVYGHKMKDMLLDAEQGTVNFEYFRRYFDEVSLPFEVAKRSLGERYRKGRSLPQDPFVKFVKLSTLRKRQRIPSHGEIFEELVDYKNTPGFKLVGRLDIFGGGSVFDTTPCVFLSHRWLSIEHPDPDGTRLRQIIERFDEIQKESEAVLPEIYLWIDYCCLPQRAEGRLSGSDEERLRSGLEALAEVVKSCDLLVLDSPDYVRRAWCFAEIFVWLAKVTGTTQSPRRKGIFRSVLSRHLFPPDFSSAGSDSNDKEIIANLRLRGFTGDDADILSICQPLKNYTGKALDSASYDVPSFESEYLPNLVDFMCTVWQTLQARECTEPGDREVCLRVVVEALKFAEAPVWTN